MLHPHYPPILSSWSSVVETQPTTRRLIPALNDPTMGHPRQPRGAIQRQPETTRPKEGIKERLRPTDRHEIREYVDETLRKVNGRESDPGSFDHLDRILSEQHYWLSFWRLANEEINYRRFFAVSELVSLRVEDPRVFDASHDLVLRLARKGKVTGLRVDHVDGLYDPHGYLVRLMQRLTGSEDENPSPGFYVLVEKILGRDEALPPAWPIHGTTGYDFMNALNGVFVSAGGVKTLDEIYARFTGTAPDFREIVYRSKRLTMDTLFAGEMHSLGQHLGRLAEQDRYARDLPRKELRAAVVEATACFPTYRTYACGHELSARDVRYIAKALKEAQQRSTEASTPVFDFLRRVLLQEIPPSLVGNDREDWLRLPDALAAVHGPDHGERVRGYLAVHLQPARLDERGRRRPFLQRDLRKRVPRPRRNDGLPLAPFHERHVDPRHQEKRGCPGAGQRPLGNPGGVGKTAPAVEPAERGTERIVNGIATPGPGEEILLYQDLLGAWPLDEKELPGFRNRMRTTW